MQTIKLVRAFNDNRFNATNQQHPTTSPVQHPKPGKLAVLIGLPEQVKELLGHEDLDDHNHGPDVEMPHVYQKREARHHPQRGVGPDEHRLLFVPVVRQQVCATVLVHIRMDLNITINNNEGSMLHDFSTPVTKNLSIHGGTRMTSLERFRCRRRPPCVGPGEPGVASPEPLSLCICWALGRSVRINLGFFHPKKRGDRSKYGRVGAWRSPLRASPM
jgi:hypothetical protein